MAWFKCETNVRGGVVSRSELDSKTVSMSTKWYRSTVPNTEYTIADLTNPYVYILTVRSGTNQVLCNTLIIHDGEILMCSLSPSENGQIKDIELSSNGVLKFVSPAWGGEAKVRKFIF